MSIKPTIYTIGHSNRSIDEFIRLLKKFRIEVLVDVRRFPSSKFDHFRQENLRKALQDNGIEYIWIQELGGYRKRVLENSPNIAIKSEGFRNYADYMLTDEFRNAVEKLAEVARGKRACIMCAEKLYWRCHRMLISDFLVAIYRLDVIHILDLSNIRKHKVSRYARKTPQGLIYDVIH